jgi:hypothetical protein
LVPFPLIWERSAERNAERSLAGCSREVLQVRSSGHPPSVRASIKTAERLFPAVSRACKRPGLKSGSGLSVAHHWLLYGGNSCRLSSQCQIRRTVPCFQPPVMARHWTTRACSVFMEIYLTASDLASIYHVALGTIHSWASRDSWRRTETWPRKYHVEDAQASYDRRRRRHARPPTASGIARPRQKPR